MAGFFSQNSCANDVSVEFIFFGFQFICVIIYSQDVYAPQPKVRCATLWLKCQVAGSHESCLLMLQ